MEIWKAVNGYEGLYEVSSYGNVKSLERKLTYSNGEIHIHKERILRQETVNINYKRVSLSKNNIVKRESVHRLVAKAFIPNLENKPQINHIDGNPSNNSMENLEWCTGSENMIHAYKTGLQKPLIGEDHGNCKVSHDIVKEIRSMHQLGYKIKDILLKFEISQEYCRRIIRNKVWIDTDYSPFTRRRMNYLKYIEFVNIVQQLKQDGLTKAEISRRVGIDFQAVTAVLERPIYQEWYNRNRVNSGEA